MWVLNLINNSIFAIKTIGTITISISTENNKIVIKFTDDGQGIDEREFENIFKPFVSYNNKPQNKGLGLYIAKRIIEKHSGTITVVSERNVFTTFTVSLPLKEV